MAEDAHWAAKAAAEAGAELSADLVAVEVERLSLAGEPPATWPGWLWAASRATARASVLTRLGSGRDKVQPEDLGLATQLFTPAAMSTWMAARALDGAGSAPHIYDPCCGTGNLLVATVFEAARRGLPRLQLTGYDLDGGAVRVARVCVERAARDAGLDVALGLHTATPDGPDASLGSLVWTPEAAATGVLTNPPWLYQRNMDPVLRAALKGRDAASSRDLYAAFLDRCVELVAVGGHAVLLTPRTFLAVRQYRALRERLASRARLVDLVDLGPGRFPALSGEKSACALSVWSRGGRGETRYWDLTGMPMPPVGEPTIQQSVSTFSSVQGQPWAFGVAPGLLAVFARHPPLGDRIDITGAQNITADNARFVRFHWEVPTVHTDGQTPAARVPHFRPYAKGGRLRRYAGNLEHVVDWSQAARDHYASARTATLLNASYWYREGITYTDLTTNGFHARHLPPGCVFDKAGPALFPRDPEELLPLLGLLNTPLVQGLLGVLNSSLHTQVADVRALPVPREMPPTVRQSLAAHAARCLAAARFRESHTETSPTFARPWLNGLVPGGLGDQISVRREAWSRQATAARESHRDLGATVAAWYGVEESATLPEQPPLQLDAPDDFELLAQCVAVAAAELAESGNGVLDLDGLVRRLAQSFDPAELARGLGESVRDHMLGGAYWTRHLSLHRRSPRLWLVPRAAGGPQLIPFQRVGEHGYALAPGSGSRQGWRLVFGADPR